MTSKRKIMPVEGGGKNYTPILGVVLIISMLAVVFLLAKSMEKSETTTTQATTRQTTTTIKQDAGAAAVDGDVVEIDYIGKYLNGTVFDTSIEDVAVSSGTYNSMRTYEPMIITIGLYEVVQGVEEAIVGMKVGEEKTITVPPEKGFGYWTAENLEQVLRVENTSRVENISLSLFENVTGEKAEVGKTIKLTEMLWPITMVEVKDDQVFIKHNPDNGTIIPTLFGNSSLWVTEDRIYSRLEVNPGDRIITPSGYVKVINVTDDEVTIDANHELVDQTLVFYIKLVSINQAEDPYADQILAEMQTFEGLQTTEGEQIY